MKGLIRWGLSILLGTSIGIVYHLFLIEQAGFSDLNGMISLLYLSILFSSVVYVLLFKLIIPRLSEYSTRAKVLWLAGILLAGIWLAIAIPIPIPAIPPTTHTLEVIATGQKDPRSQGNEVWLSGLYLPNGSKVDISEFDLGNGWSIRDGVPVSFQNQPSVLRWRGLVDANLRLDLVAHPWSGFVQIVVDGSSQEFNLYNDTGISKEITLPIKASQTPWFYYLITYLGFGFILFFSTTSLILLLNKKLFLKRLTVALLFGVPCSLFCLTFYLSGMSFSPAISVFAFLTLFVLISCLVYFTVYHFAIPSLERLGYSNLAIYRLLAGMILAGIFLVFVIPVNIPPTISFQLGFILVLGLVLGILLFSTLLFLVMLPFSRIYRFNLHVKNLWVFLALFPFAVWMVYALTYWPGLMVSDFFGQWSQVLHFQFDDGHPAFHTILMWLITRIYPSPGLISFAQIISLSLLVGYIFKRLIELGINKFALILNSLFLSWLPVSTSFGCNLG